MNIGQLFQKVKDLIVAVQVGNYLVAVTTLLEILRAITDTMPPAAFGVPLPVRGSSLDCDAATEAELVAELQKVSSMSFADGSEKPTGPAIDILKPILLALLKKWLGV